MNRFCAKQRQLIYMANSARTLSESPEKYQENITRCKYFNTNCIEMNDRSLQSYAKKKAYNSVLQVPQKVWMFSNILRDLCWFVLHDFAVRSQVDQFSISDREKYEPSLHLVGRVFVHSNICIIHCVRVGAPVTVQLQL